MGYTRRIAKCEMANFIIRNFGTKHGSNSHLMRMQWDSLWKLYEECVKEFNRIHQEEFVQRCRFCKEKPLQVEDLTAKKYRIHGSPRCNFCKQINIVADSQYEATQRWNASVVEFMPSCPLGGDETNDCEDCAYSVDYHYEDGECIKRKPAEKDLYIVKERYKIGDEYFENDFFFTTKKANAIKRYNEELEKVKKNEKDGDLFFPTKEAVSKMFDDNLPSFNWDNKDGSGNFYWLYVEKVKFQNAD